MAKRIEIPNVDDIGGAGSVALTTAEFEEFLKVLAKGTDSASIAGIRQTGFFGPMPRADWEQLFQAYKMQSDIQHLMVCREDCFDAMLVYIDFLYREGTWPRPTG